MRIQPDYFTGQLLMVPRTTGSASLAAEETDIAEIQAAVDIPALSLITANGQIADSNNIAHFNRVVGIVMAAVLTGFIAEAVVEGEPSWSWAPNSKLFLNGTTLSATPPSSGFSQLVGIARNVQTVFIRLQVPILL
jgi:hypothetical protein